MPRGYRYVILAAFGWLVLLGNSEQNRRSDYRHSQQHTPAKPAAAPEPNHPPSPDQTGKHCYGTSQPWLSCDAISAQAAINQARDADKQARDADKQASVVWWQFGVGALTLAAAVAAAIFAWRAAHHTRRSADAAHEANRPWIDVSIIIDGISVAYNKTGYDLNIALTFYNDGNSPANHVQEYIDGIFIDDIPRNDKEIFDISNREPFLQSRADFVASKLSSNNKTGPTVCPNREQTIYVQVTLPWDLEKGYPSTAAWLTVGVRYSFPDGVGESIKLFVVRSFGFPNYSGFDFIGTDGGSYTATDAKIVVWPHHGYAR